MAKENKIEKSAEKRIIAAATKLFVTKGFDGAKMRHIADEAGINQAMIYYYFRSKKNLFTLVFENAIEKFIVPFRCFQRRDLDILDKIELFCQELMEIQNDNHYLSIFILYEIVKNPERLKNEILLRQKESLKLFSDEIKKNIKNKTIRKIDPAHLFINIVSLCFFPFLTMPLFAKIANHPDIYTKDFIELQKNEIRNMIT